MRALVIAHDPLAEAAVVGAHLERHGVALEPFVVVTGTGAESTEPFPDPRRYDLVVAMGAPWSVYDTATIGSWIGRELECLRTAQEAGVPVLGICFGGQALAAALGGEVARAPAPEVGWCGIDTDRPDVLAPGPWFQWHVDRFTPPPGAEELARSAAGPQAYRVGRALGVQFHPEMDDALLASWLDHCPAEEQTALRIDGDALLAATRAHQDVARAATGRLVDWFCEEIAGWPR